MTTKAKAHKESVDWRSCCFQAFTWAGD